jgi:PAS domain S-box-containing protein
MRLSAILGQREGVTIEERLKIGERGYSFLTMRAPLIVGDTDHDTLISQGPRAVLEANGVRAIVVMPLPTPNRTIGILTIGHTHPHVWQQREIDLLQTVANQTANAIHNAQLFQNILNEQRKVQAIFDSGISGLYATDAEGRIAMFNRAAERITGWSRQEVLGKLWDDVFVDPTAPRPVEPLIRLALVRKQTAYFPDGKKIQTRDGRIIPVAKAVAPLIDDGGHVTGAVGALWDLTREKAAERSRENFLRMVAHQMRNPLTVLVSALALLDNPHLPKKRRAEMYDLVKSQAERLKTFSEQFLDLEKALHSESAVAMEPVAILPLIHQLIGEFQAEHPGYHFYVEGGQPEPIVLANPDRLDNILRNLLDNAVTYSPESRPITVSTQVPEEGDRVDIAIRDEGIGIPFPDQEHIFDAFYRSTQPEGRQTYGHGFGLFIARQMARQMDGDIEFTSQEHQGSTFHLILRRSSHGESEYDSSRG